MPHPGHFICSDNCKFHLFTYVGKYMVSTVGELFFDSAVREITAESRGIKLEGKGDYRKHDYMKKIGYEEIGCGRKYETMVFRAVKSKDKCCPYTAKSWDSIDFNGYNTPEDATQGHYKLCKKWSK